MTDKDLIELLCKDDVFRESIESEYGKIKEIFPDWIERTLVYHFANETFKHSDIDLILKAIKDVGYGEQFAH